LYRRFLENSIFCLGIGAFSGCSEKIGLIGFSELYVNFITIQNQPYLIKMKNFDKENHDNEKIYNGKFAGTSILNQKKVNKDL
jgi:hypothetical protein